ncbi:MAG: heavy-metal-associated domain-containing protein [Prevotella sp.]|nr:heavy-metal-associated domain-containing protein [Prevotella sp.]
MNKTFTVDGMKCPHCQANVENALKALPGVRSAKADIEAKSVTVDYDDAQVAPEQLKQAVDEAGHYEMTL